MIISRYVKTRDNRYCQDIIGLLRLLTGVLRLFIFLDSQKKKNGRKIVKYRYGNNFNDINKKGKTLEVCYERCETN